MGGGSCQNVFAEQPPLTDQRASYLCGMGGGGRGLPVQSLSFGPSSYPLAVPWAVHLTGRLWSRLRWPVVACCTRENPHTSWLSSLTHPCTRMGAELASGHLERTPQEPLGGGGYKAGTTEEGNELRALTTTRGVR